MNGRSKPYVSLGFRSREVQLNPLHRMIVMIAKMTDLNGHELFGLGS